VNFPRDPTSPSHSRGAFRNSNAARASALSLPLSLSLRTHAHRRRTRSGEKAPGEPH
jgi:hypothetical protein